MNIMHFCRDVYGVWAPIKVSGRVFKMRLPSRTSKEHGCLKLQFPNCEVRSAFSYLVYQKDFSIYLNWTVISTGSWSDYYSIPYSQAAPDGRGIRKTSVTCLLTYLHKGFRIVKRQNSILPSLHIALGPSFMIVTRETSQLHITYYAGHWSGDLSTRIYGRELFRSWILLVMPTRLI